MRLRRISRERRAYRQTQRDVTVVISLVLTLATLPMLRRELPLQAQQIKTAAAAPPGRGCHLETRSANGRTEGDSGGRRREARQQQRTGRRRDLR